MLGGSRAFRLRALHWQTVTLKLVARPLMIAL
jgi:hypothetical protein